MGKDPDLYHGKLTQLSFAALPCGLPCPCIICAILCNGCAVLCCAAPEALRYSADVPVTSAHYVQHLAFLLIQALGIPGNYLV